MRVRKRKVEKQVNFTIRQKTYGEKNIKQLFVLNFIFWGVRGVIKIIININYNKNTISKGFTFPYKSFRNSARN